MGVPRAKRPAGREIVVSRFESPFGKLIAAAADGGVCLLEFEDVRRFKPELADLRRRLGAETEEGDNADLVQLRRELGEYFLGRRTRFGVSLVTPGSAFQERVWRELGAIEYGTTRTYSELAGRIGRPSAVRAVGAANGANRISILVPCHRVVGMGGQLTGYGGGLWRKRRLLELEGAIGPRDQLAQLALLADASTRRRRPA
jgi:AraC family transcriptional regulator, regulatory protein of adaptative response / methylated-DNA-[protein]-cysteine methyltransferase